MKIERSWDLGMIAPGLPSLQLRRLDATVSKSITFSGAALAERVGEPDLIFVDFDSSAASSESGMEKLSFSAIMPSGNTARLVIGIQYIFPDSKGAWVLAFRNSPRGQAAMEQIAAIVARSFKVKAEENK